MVCYGPRLGTVAFAGLIGYALFHRVIIRILEIAGLVAEITLLTCVAAGVAALVTWIVRSVRRRRAAVGACTTCRFRCQQPLTPLPRPPVAGQARTPAWQNPCDLARPPARPEPEPERRPAA